jgi:hypothetical protein
VEDLESGKHWKCMTAVVCGGDNNSVKNSRKSRKNRRKCCADRVIAGVECLSL